MISIQTTHLYRLVTVWVGCLLFIRCSGNIGSVTQASSAAGPSYTLSGTISGLSGTVVLQNSNGDSLSLNTNSSFAFTTAISANSTYSVTVKTQPSAYTCFVSNGSGTASANVSNISVNCIAGKRIYVTSSTFTGNLTGSFANGIMGADSNCMADSNKPSDLAQAKALLVDGTNRGACSSTNCTGGGTTENTDWVLAPLTQYLRPDGTVIGSTNAGGVFASGTSLANSIATTHTQVWTGLGGVASEWKTDTNSFCSGFSPGWTSNTPARNGNYGFADGTQYGAGANAAFSSTNAVCTNALALYCVEQ